MAYLNLNPSLKNTRANATLTAIGANATVNFYSGAIPSDPSVAPAGVLLATLAASATFGTVTGVVLTANAITSGTGTGGAGAGTAATFARIATAGGTGIVDLDVTATGGGGSVQVNTTTISTGVSVSITSLTITEA